MLVIRISERKPRPAIVTPIIPPKQEQPPSTNYKGFMAEALRRSNIITKLIAECPFKVGDTVIPADNKESQEEAVILDIVTNYMEFNSGYKWPKVGDNPMIITCRSKKTIKEYYCTTNYLKKV